MAVTPRGRKEAMECAINTCPHCGRKSDSIKQLRVPYRWICLLVYIRIFERVEVACPQCMRAILWRALIVNLSTANIAWPAMAILYIPRFAATRRDGPTVVPLVTNPLLQDVGAAPSPWGLLRSIVLALVLVGAISGLALALGGKGNDPAKPAGWVCFGISLVVVVKVLSWRPKSPKP